MKKPVFLLFLFILPLIFAGEINHEDLFHSSVEKYRNGDYEKALSGFIKITQQNSSADIYYNIGNCYMKTGDLGKAVAAYLSARKRDAKDADIKHNLDFALTKTKDQFTLNDISGVGDLIQSFIGGINIRKLQILYIFLLLIFSFTVLRSFFLTKSFREVFWIISFLMILMSFILYQRVKMWNIETGVADSEEVVVRYGPGHSETEAFRIHEGAFFQIHNRNSNWLQISILNGKTGWVLSEDVVIVK